MSDGVLGVLAVKINVLFAWAMAAFAGDSQQGSFAAVGTGGSGDMFEPSGVAFEAADGQLSGKIASLLAVEASNSPVVVGVDPSHGELPHRIIRVPREIDLVGDRLGSINKINA